MNSGIQSYPLTWPGSWKRTDKRARKRAEFEKTVYQGDAKKGRRVTINDAMERLFDQLSRLGVATREDVVISTNIRTRLDGLPYSGEPEPEDPGCAVYWRIRKNNQTKCMAIDIYDRTADNIAAVALTLAYMRGIERHGGAEVLDRVFLGFQALPEPEQWWKVLGFDLAPKTRQEAEDAFRSLAKVHHPDIGGETIQFARISHAIEQARKVLSA
jgi:hypothetical protein